MSKVVVWILHHKLILVSMVRLTFYRAENGFKLPVISCKGLHDCFHTQRSEIVHAPRARVESVLRSAGCRRSWGNTNCWQGREGAVYLGSSYSEVSEIRLQADDECSSVLFLFKRKSWTQQIPFSQSTNTEELGASATAGFDGNFMSPSVNADEFNTWTSHLQWNLRLLLVCFFYLTVCYRHNSCPKSQHGFGS